MQVACVFEVGGDIIVTVKTVYVSSSIKYNLKVIEKSKKGYKGENS